MKIFQLSSVGIVERCRLQTVSDKNTEHDARDCQRWTTNAAIVSAISLKAMVTGESA